MHERLRRAREAAGIKSAAQAAARLGMNASAYRAHENGQNRFDHAAALRYARAFDVSAEWLFYGGDLTFSEWQDRQASSRPDTADTTGTTVAKSEPHDIPDIDPSARTKTDEAIAVAGFSSEERLSAASRMMRGSWRLPHWFLQRRGLSPKSTVALEILGDAMAPGLCDGDVAFFDTGHRIPSPDGIYAIVDCYGRVVAKRLQSLDGRIRVSSDNAHHDVAFADETLQVVGRYVCRLTD